MSGSIGGAGGIGGLVAEYEYDPFGEELRVGGRQIAQELPLRYQTKFFDKETELSHFGFRHYTATLGRFINRDPVEEPGRWRQFVGLRYGNHNPFYGARKLGGSWLAEFQTRQDTLTQNTSLPHTTEAVGVGIYKNINLPVGEVGTKKYSANANNTGHIGQGGKQTPDWYPLVTPLGSPSPYNRDTNLYSYAGNDPVNGYDAYGLFWDPNSGGWGISEWGTFAKAAVVDPVVETYKEGSAHAEQAFQAVADGNYGEAVLHATATVGSATQIALDVTGAGKVATDFASGTTKLLGKGVNASVNNVQTKSTNLWKPGDSPHAPTRVSDTPSDSTVRRREWKNEAESPTRSDYTEQDMQRMQKGEPPQRFNPDKPGVESMERSHEPIPKRDGGTETVPRWPQEHKEVDSHRHPGY